MASSAASPGKHEDLDIMVGFTKHGACLLGWYILLQRCNKMVVTSSPFFSIYIPLYLRWTVRSTMTFSDIVRPAVASCQQRVYSRLGGFERQD